MRDPYRFWHWQERARWIAARGLVAGSCLVTVTARGAAPERVSAHLVWTSTVCGEVERFASRVTWRTRHVRFVEHGEQLRFELGIERDGAGLVASVAFAPPGRAQVRRQITSPDCNDALDALALVVAIGVDERWRSLQGGARPAAAASRGADPARKPRAAAAPPDATPEPTVTPDAAPGPEPEAPAPEPPQEETPSEHAEGAPPPPPSLPPAATARVNESSAVRLWSIGVSAAALTGAAPLPLLGAELWVRARWEHGWPWSPELGLSAGYGWRDDYARADGKANFALGRVGAELCPLRIGGTHFEFQPCAAGDVGSFRAGGHETFRPQSETRPWGSLGVNAQAVAHFGWFELRALAGVSHPFVRDRFRFADPDCGSDVCGDGTFHRVAPWVGRFALGAGVRF